jgi:hypothetical protein
MRRVRTSGHIVLVAVCIWNSAAAQSSHNLFERASTCADASFNQCTEAGLPSSFCCPSSSTCVALAANTTVLCCPTGADCSTIKPIPCDVTLQNATLYPDNTLKTTALTGTLPTCGSQCCPFGYACNSAGNCVMNADQQTSVPTISTTSSPSSTRATASTHSSSAPTSASAPAKTTTATLTASCNMFPIGAILVGFFPGLVLGALLTVASICLLGAHRRKADRRRSGSSFGNISEPQPSGDMRTDFLRKPPQTPSTDNGSSPARRNTVQRVRSLFRKPNSTNGSPEQDARPAPPIPLMVQRPVTPRMQREPSYEDINIFADGDTASALRERERENGLELGGPLRDGRASHQTTFTDMMERSGLAGLQKGQREYFRH